MRSISWTWLLVVWLGTACDLQLPMHEGAGSDASVVDDSNMPPPAGGHPGDAAGSGGGRDDGATRSTDAGAVSNRRDAGDLAASDDAGLVANADAGAAKPVSSQSAGCATGEGMAAGVHMMQVDGQRRRFTLHLPQQSAGGAPPAQGWPVIFALHGNGGDLEYWNRPNGTGNIRGAVRGEAIIVVPEGIGGRWRDSRLPASAWPRLIEQELAFFDAITERLKAELCVNERAIFAMGFSGGGSFSALLACHRDYVRAIAVGGSVLYFDPAACVSTPAAWITIGVGDLSRARQEFRDHHRRAAACDAAAHPTEPTPCVAYEGCAEDLPVHYCQHGGGHIWPAFGTEAAWRFFQSFLD